jgi:adenosine deaminase/adenosine deaminase CECR1
LKIDNERFTMRYQNFVLRFMEPVDLKNLVVAFISADSSPLMAGVNIVSPRRCNFHERLLVAYGNV